jgi:hypothetical protein
MKSIPLAAVLLAVAMTATPAIAAMIDPTTLAQENAFLATSASNSKACQVMQAYTWVTGFEVFKSSEQARKDMTVWKASAMSSQICLMAVRLEVPFNSDAQYPVRASLIASCSVLSHFHISVLSCFGVPLESP